MGSDRADDAVTGTSAGQDADGTLPHCYFDGSGLRGAVPGPALELSGCASGQEAVAEFVTALEDIDGVTRVGLDSSELASKKGEAGSGGGGGGDCRTRDFIAQFDLVVAFDAAPVPTEEGEEAVSTTTSTEVEPSEGSEEGSEG